MTLVERIKERRRAAGEDGFTLIELLVVIIILGILAAVVVFAVGGVGDKGNQASCVIDTRTLRTAAEANFAQNGNYTVSPAGVGPGGPYPTPSATVDENALVAGGFLSEISTMHSATVADLNPADTGIGATTYGVTVLVEDGSAPGNDCGTAGTNVSASSTDDSF